ncbi:MAG: TIGR01777 family oxidoreductase [Flavihumibacter sp.]
MATVLISGGTGLVGRALTASLTSQGHSVIILSREGRKDRASAGPARYAHWNIQAGTIDEWAIAEADHIVHLAGANVAEKRWSAARKKEIVDSRVLSGELLCRAVSHIPNKIISVAGASAIGWYGPDPQVPNPQPFIETDHAHDDFLGSTCHAWEQAIVPMQALGKRLSILRTGIVLSPGGGALTEFRKPLRFGMAAILSNGRQVISWIQVDDLVRLYEAALFDPAFAGVYNAVAPRPVDNRTLTLALARRLRGKMFIPLHVPGFVLKLVLGEMSIEVLKSCTVSANKLSRQGFRFVYPEIDAAL